MGERGPVGKRDSQRRRRNKHEVETLTAAGSPIVIAPEPGEDWEPLATDWYLSLGASGQSVFFEPSDWAFAQIVADTLSRYLRAGKPNAVLFSSIMSAMSSLLTTEGDRRRLRIELSKSQEDNEDDDSDFAELLERWFPQNPPGDDAGRDAVPDGGLVRDQVGDGSPSPAEREAGR